METQALGESFHSCVEFSQTFTSVTITLWKLGKRVCNNYFIYKRKAQEICCFHRVMVNDLKSIRMGIVFCLFYFHFLLFLHILH